MGSILFMNRNTTLTFLTRTDIFDRDFRLKHGIHFSLRLLEETWMEDPAISSEKPDDDLQKMKLMFHDFLTFVVFPEIHHFLYPITFPLA